ncbi:replication-associated recombination protein A [Patescibacteria group bacterium]|nr:replication-associated recombination protein A [Patescibacteria group bacterium]MBU1890809.1 replication-associated recombination protein A [Patescibacteria group bacterium]
MTDLFENKMNQELSKEAPLSDRIRPDKLENFFGQNEIVGEGKVLRQAIENDELFSMILWGPPGSGKTTLARIIAQLTKSEFVQMSAVASGVAELRKVVRKAQDLRKFHSKRTILFVDEIHRWNKAQQDAFLPYVENGTIVLIGATTENPSFEVISPLLSRSRVYVLNRLEPEHIGKILKKALQDKKVGLGEYKVKIGKQALDLIIKASNGDARAALNAIEIAVKSTKPDKNGVRHIQKQIIEDALQHKALMYDKKGDEHYNVISAFIKSLRGSSADGALYWLARMIQAGEDPRFIARRMVILASEDIGNADPQALLIANAAAHAVDFIGFPEAQLNLAQAAIYLALAPKSNAVITGIMSAHKDVKDTLNEPVPLHLRNAPTDLMKNLGYGKEYKYSHDFSVEEGEQDYLPKSLKNKKYYHK